MRSIGLLFLFVVIQVVSGYCEITDQDTEDFYNAIEKSDVPAMEIFLNRWPVSKNQDYYNKKDFMTVGIQTGDQSVVNFLLSHHVPIDYYDDDGILSSALLHGVNPKNVGFIVDLVLAGYPITAPARELLSWSDEYLPICSAIYTQIGKDAFERLLGTYALYYSIGEKTGGFRSSLDSLYYHVFYEKSDQYNGILDFLKKRGLAKNFVEYAYFNDELRIRLFSLDTMSEVNRTGWDCYAIIGKVTSTNVRIRSKPNLEATIIGKLQTGDLVKIIGISGKRRHGGSAEFPWLKVVLQSGQDGWVYGEFVSSELSTIINL